MGSGTWLAPLAIAPVVVLLLVGIAWSGRRSGRGTRWILERCAVVTYAAVIIGLAFFPFPLPPWDPSQAIVQPWILPIPFQTISMSIGLGWEWPAARFLVGNVLAFIPVGLVYPWLRPGSHTWARAIIVGFSVSLAIETTQVAVSLIIGFPYRQFDVDDLLLNTLGASIGYGAWRWLHATR